MPLLVRSNLQQLIIVLAILSAFISVINMFIVSSQVQKHALIEGSLKNNQAYATKLAASADLFLKRAQSELSYAAKQLGINWSNPRYQKQEAQRLSEQSSAFDSVVIVNAQGIITATSNNIVDLTHRYIPSTGIVASLQAQAPIITPPFETVLNNLIIMISSPVFDPKGQYLGFIALGIYLKENYLLNQILGVHYHKNDSHTYVIDSQKRFLYHPNKNMLGQTATNLLLDQFFIQENGYRAYEDVDGRQMLGGFAYIPTANWLIVSQQSVQSALYVHEGLMLNVFLKSLPVTLAMLVIIWGLAWLIASPLRQLATQAKNMKQVTTIKRVQGINTWYFEANELKKAFLTGLKSVHEQVGQLRHDTRTDVLTGLNNRRALETILAQLTAEQTPFALLAIDVDHFKKVNDNFGHLVGDKVLKELAHVLRTNARSSDYCIRLGGEEFLVLLTHSSIGRARAFAERLRQTISEHNFPIIGHLTISCGVAAWPLHAQSTEAVFRIADEMLYAAKQNGRNQIHVAA